ncbi:MAG: glycoside hydrolase family 97 protein [Marinilabiliales bacterium]|nr:MAG: glycoside hydrolase family 97 protein [Marinilabiliales bacterium]
MTIRNVIITFCFSVVALFGSCNEQKVRNWIITSPDGSVLLTVSTLGVENYFDIPSPLSYSVELVAEGEHILAVRPSPLGIIRSDEDFSKDLELVSTHGPVVVDKEYFMISGKRSLRRDHYSEFSLTFRNSNNALLELLFRVYNEGVAFSYRFPEESDSLYTVLRELTGFHIPVPGEAWKQPYDTLGIWSPAYEYGYEPVLAVGDYPPLSTGWGFPVLFHTNGVWIFVSETAVYDEYCGSHLAADAHDGKYKLHFPHEWENYGLGDVHPVSSLPWQTPWRFIVVGTTPAPIVETTLPHDLARPVALQDVSWIKPGISSWSWWSDHSSSYFLEPLKQYVDLASGMDWPYSLVDAGWHVMSGGTVEELIEYAGMKEVGIYLWYNSGGPHTKVMDAGPRDLMHDREIRREEFERISKLGVKGVKIDFFQSEKQNMIQLYLDILRDAADFELMVNFHGCTFPRGWERTYPNLVTMEGVRGAELYSYPGFPPTAPYLNSIYPFTRNVMGSMDYTPVTFTDFSPQSIRQTTWAHELALSVLFESALQHFADNIKGFRKQPREVLEFLSSVPTVWDNTWFIDGYPGRLAVLCREKDDIFYLAGINGEMVPKEFTFTLGHLPEGSFKMSIIADGEHMEDYKFKDMVIGNETPVSLHLLPAGGFVAQITRI